MTQPTPPPGRRITVAEHPNLAHSTEDPLILLLHDGELRDLRSQLDAFGIPIRERVGALRPAEAKAQWRTVIATPKRLLEFSQPGGPRPTLVAIADQASKTLRSQMQRLRIDYVVNRPVHPMALRLLLLHAVYNGPERRKRERVSIGAEIRVRTGLFAKPATLAEISQKGARILTDQPVEKGTKLRLAIGRELTKAGMLRVNGTAVRIQDGDEDGTIVGIRFDEMSKKAAEHVKRFVDLHRRGPVQVRHQVAGVSRVMNNVAESSPVAERPARPAPARAKTAPKVASVVGPAAPAAVAEPAPNERRGADRVNYESRVVALVDEAARVFLGRDISTGGMRVDSHPELGLGFKVKLALHAGPRSEPVLVEAVVDRDDGPDGIFLRFLNLTDGLAREITQVMQRVDVSDGDDEAGLVVSELIAVEAAAT